MDYKTRRTFLACHLNKLHLLSPRRETIVRHRLDWLTYRQIGVIINISIERVRQLEKDSVDTLLKHL